ncbi:MAG: hypothetical protein JST49_10370 [Bacteroidetes bacterium]|nr:hypothetical protein [Bacteroidota bacterium]
MKTTYFSKFLAASAIGVAITMQSFTASETIVTEPHFVSNISTKERAKIVPNTKTYVLQAPQPGETMPRKVCKAIGKDCKNNASAAVTEFEWDTFFYGYKAEDFDYIEIQAHQEYIGYLQGIGFGM